MKTNSSAFDLKTHQILILYGGGGWKSEGKKAGEARNKRVFEIKKKKKVCGLKGGWR